MFLYDVTENRALRDPTPLLEKSGNTFIRRPAPVRMDCSYIVTAWSTASGDTKVATEHELLAEALQWLMGFPVLPDGALQGTLVSAVYAPTMLIAQADPNKSAGDFWYALGIPPRPAFYLTVNLALSLGTVVQGSLVTTHLTSTGSPAAPPEETWIQVGGRVLNAAGKGIAGAVVDIVDASLRTTSTEDGRFSFLRVPEGVHVLQAAAVGFLPTTQSLTVPSPSGKADVILNPLP
jgi:hypothetical protein